MMECFRDKWAGGRGIESWPDLPGIASWLTGKKFPAPPPDPIVLTWDPEDEEGPPQAMYKAGIPMMTRRMHDALRQAGVDNLDVYPVEVRSRASSEGNRDYVAFNVIGVIRAADMSKSRHDPSLEPHLIAVGFDGVTIDESKTGGALLFRLAENVTAIVVHDRVKRHLEGLGLGVTFVPPEKWVG
jgi:hypothetical protein